MHGTELHWLPENPRWAEQLTSFSAHAPGEAPWAEAVALAQSRLSALQTMQLDRRVAKALAGTPKPETIKLAVLASSTVDHLLPAVRIGGLRRSIRLETYTPAYGQYAQELLDTGSHLHRFQPQIVLFTLDAHHLIDGLDLAAGPDGLVRLLDRLAGQWDAARRVGAGQIIQTIPLPVFLPTLGNNEHRCFSRLTALRQLTALLRDRADAHGVDLIALDDRVARDGLAAWHDPALWHRAKQEIHPQAAPLFGDLAARLITAARGLSKKCLVLDLDNTLWGGVIGDDGLAGIKLGQGSARGEAHVAFQQYAKDLSRRGIILAVCSKNDEANALEPFERHPDMVLKREDIACFIANWTDKATNLRQIAARLNIGIDSLVFADDNPAERAIVRQELPAVTVPELPEDPTFYAQSIADSGCFEAVRLTAEDGQRAAQYRQNVERETLLETATDMDAYLRSLSMRAVWDRFDATGLPRIVQLMNKTNQFNLTTRRVSADEIEAFIADRSALSLQIRLIDQFGDNGIIAIVAGRFETDGRSLRIEHWLMSCRVLGRGMEAETLNLVAAEAIRLGVDKLIGEYRPTAKNDMVREHYKRLGFAPVATTDDASTLWSLDLADFVPRSTFISSERAQAVDPALVPA